MSTISNNPIVQDALQRIRNEETDKLSKVNALSSLLKKSRGSSYYGFNGTTSDGVGYLVSCTPNCMEITPNNGDPIQLTWKEVANELIDMRQMKPVESNLSYAIQLNGRILANAQAAQVSLYEVCKGLKEMRDGKLYKELGYSNFEQYCETEVGIKRIQAHKYISVIEKLGSNFVSPGKQNLGIKKLYLLSTLSESDRTELTERVDLEGATARQLEAEIDQLKREKQSVSDTADQLRKQCMSQQEQVRQLEEQVQELENRPIEVAVETSREVEQMRDAMNRNSSEWGKRYDALQEENLTRERELHQKYQQQLKEQKADYEQQLAQAEQVPYEAGQEWISIAEKTVHTAVKQLIQAGRPVFLLYTRLKKELELMEDLMKEEPSNGNRN